MITNCSKSDRVAVDDVFGVKWNLCLLKNKESVLLSDRDMARVLGKLSSLEGPLGHTGAYLVAHRSEHLARIFDDYLRHLDECDIDYCDEELDENKDDDNSREVPWSLVEREIYQLANSINNVISKISKLSNNSISLLNYFDYFENNCDQMDFYIYGQKLDKIHEILRLQKEFPYLSYFKTSSCLGYNVNDDRCDDREEKMLNSRFDELCKLSQLLGLISEIAVTHKSNRFKQLFHEPKNQSHCTEWLVEKVLNLLYFEILNGKPLPVTHSVGISQAIHDALTDKNSESVLHTEWGERAYSRVIKRFSEIYGPRPFMGPEDEIADL